MPVFLVLNISDVDISLFGYFPDYDNYLRKVTYLPRTSLFILVLNISDVDISLFGYSLDYDNYLRIVTYVSAHNKSVHSRTYCTHTLYIVPYTVWFGLTLADKIRL